MRCCSGKHEWSDPVSASRCCHPDWSRELRYGMSDRLPGDAEDGATVVHGGGGMCWVWHYLPSKTKQTEKQI